MATDEGDGRIVRNLTASTDAKSGRQGNFSNQHQRISLIYNTHFFNFHCILEFIYLVHTYTGDKRGAGTDANVTVTIFGHDGDSGEHKLDNARNNFERAK